MEKDVFENHARYLERKKLYRKYGVDIDRERKFILEKAKPVSGNILEVGTGKGHFALVLAKEGYQFTSVDISEEEQKIAQLNLKYFELENAVKFKVEDAERLSFKNTTFDVIFSINTIHHFSSPFKVMDELARIVTFGGKIILSDFNKKGFEIIDKVHAADGGIHETTEFGLRDMETCFRKKGFKVSFCEDKFQEILTIFKPKV